MPRQVAHQCPCCDYFTLERRASFDVCFICYWEDDGQDLDEVDRVSDPNHITLRQARENFRDCGASDRAAVSLVATAAQRDGVRREIRSC